MNKIAQLALRTILGMLTLCGIIFVALVVYYWPVVDRLIVRPCHYYPNAITDCKEV